MFKIQCFVFLVFTCSHVKTEISIILLSLFQRNLRLLLFQLRLKKSYETKSYKIRKFYEKY